MVIPAGIHHNFGMLQYHNWKLDKAKLSEGPISNSMLKAFAPSPFEWLRAGEFKQTIYTTMGSLYDAALSDDKLGEGFALKEYPDYKTKAAREWRDAQLTAGVTIYTEDQWDEAKKAAETVRSHEVASEILEGAHLQTAVITEVGGIPAKCLLDIVPTHLDWDDWLFDYKTISTGLDDVSIRKAIGNFKYHWQAAFYRTAWNQIARDHGEIHRNKFGFIFQSTVTREVRVVELKQEAMNVGIAAVKAALAVYAKCAKRGIHSAYANQSTEIDLMPYHALDDEEWAASFNQEGAE